MRDYTECDETADTMALPEKFLTFDECLALLAEKMPGEDKAGTIVNNVAWSLYQRQDNAQRSSRGGSTNGR